MITTDIPIILDYPRPKNKKDLLTNMINHIKDNKSSVLTYGVNSVGNSTSINIVIRSSRELDEIVYEDANTKK